MARYIDSETMIKRLEKWNTSDDKDKALYNFALNRIVEQPTADVVEVVHGEWERIEKKDESRIINVDFRCSVCRRFRFHNGELRRYKYCPNCGAKMDGKKVE